MEDWVTYRNITYAITKSDFQSGGSSIIASYDTHSVNNNFNTLDLAHSYATT